MPFITTEKEQQLYYEDLGSGQPVILIHGWPLSHKAWEGQVLTLLDAGYRVITYDRRGFGASSAPDSTYDYTQLAGDLRKLILDLDLKDCVLVGFSMGGGEVVRYFTEYGDDRIAKAALISSIIPLVKQKEDNPDGVPEENLNGIMKSLKSNRIGFLNDFHKNFYNYDKLSNLVPEEQLHYDWSIAAHASPLATIRCAEAWAETDFRDELKNLSVPTLIVHGAADAIVPIETSGDQAAKGIPNNTYEVIPDGPHGLNVTHKISLNEKLLHFLKA